MVKKLIVLASIALAALGASVAEAQSHSGGHPIGGFGGRPSFDLLLNAFDADESGDLSEEEVPGRVWYRLSQADSDDNGVVTQEEFESYGRP